MLAPGNPLLIRNRDAFAGGGPALIHTNPYLLEDSVSHCKCARCATVRMLSSPEGLRPLRAPNSLARKLVTVTNRNRYRNGFINA